MSKTADKIENERRDREITILQREGKNEV